MYYSPIILVVLKFLFFFCLNNEIHGHASFSRRIPNGDNIDHPCYPHAKWTGVGHISEGGKGALNEFGKDFHAADSKWTKELCEKDSDKDGLKNGEELGDPNCEWTVNKTPTRTTNISHPGVCNPCDSDDCKTKNAAFGKELYESPKLQCKHAQDSDVRDYRLTLTNVSADETTYICQAFEISTTENFYMVANEPIINNSQVLHHMLAFGCSIKPENTKFTTPYTCFMNSGVCSTLIATWSFGVRGECLDQRIYVSLGKDTFPYMIIQLHWNNPSKLENLKDSSGFRFHFSKTKRSYEAGMMMIAQFALEIPPGKSQINVTANCMLNATNQETINVTSASPHMHLRGHYASIEQYRNGTKVFDILPYQLALYSSPPFIHFPSQTIQKGDELRMVCTYNTMNFNETAFYGEGTNDEMCMGFLRYYPKLSQSVDVCFTYNNHILDNIYIRSIRQYKIGDCEVKGFIQQDIRNYVSELDQVCGLDLPVCQGECKRLVEKIQENPCLKGQARNYLLFGRRFFGTSTVPIDSLMMYLSQCELNLQRQLTTAPTTSCPVSTTNSRFQFFAPGNIVSIVFLAIFFY